MNLARLIKTRFALIHVLLWISVWFFFVYFFSYNNDNTRYILWFSSLLLPLTMGVTYFMVYYLIPRYLLTRKYWEYGLYSFYLLVFTSYEIVLLLYGCLYFLLNFNISNMPPMSKNFTFVLVLVILVVGFVSFVYLLNHNFKTISRNKELENKILATNLQLKEQELHYLKMQIHPHFLFNTLNTIYGFALKQSKQTPDIILKLSNLLDYILYQVNKPKVSLKEEVLHIREYIELEKIRFQDSLSVKLESSEIDENIQVAPMLMIPFVENAFKHGTLKGGFLQIEIQVKLTGHQLEFAIRNSFNQREKETEKNGIGLENIRKRLELHYKNNYELHIEPGDEWFSAQLIIFNLNLKANV
ncbi:sensor histidine kinase [Mangrovibacterium lignilyticum]|uniref:sensor histidine kinase n=1 Tax=Mangrovibacterium lignilyticum TaxID=2668052 RepID=UPI0013D40E37|nr:histidine kinase [Mangrovibacterium lignilyticum]